MAAIGAGLGYALGALRNERERTAALEQQVKMNTAHVQAHGAVITRIAEDYEPIEDTPEQRRKAFTVIKGGRLGVLILPLAFLATRVRRHWRPAAAIVGTAAATAALTAALLAHGSPPPRPYTAIPPTRSARTPGVPSVAPSASTSRARPAPSRPPGRTPPVIPLPVRTRRSTPATAPAPASPSGPPPTPASPAPRPTPSCTLVYLDALHVISICI